MNYYSLLFRSSSVPRDIERGDESKFFGVIPENAISLFRVPSFGGVTA